jgi:PX domain
VCLSQSKHLITSPKAVNKGLFSKTYTAFTVKTSPFSYEVERRFNDFYWLRTCLVNEYPGVYVAPIDEKVTVRNKLDPVFLKERIFMLQEFMNSISEHPELKLSPHLYIFLKCPEGESFEKSKKELEKVINPNAVLVGGPINLKMFYQKNPIKVEHTTNINGMARCRIDGPLKELHGAADAAIKEYLPAYSKCRETSLQLSLTLATAKTQIDQLASELETLQQTASKFNDTVGRDSNYNWSSLETIYGSLCDTLKTYSRHS